MTINRFLLTPCLVAASLVAGFPARAARFIVNSTEDAVDATPGDGICATAHGKCTMRAAIQESNALPGADEIFVPGAVYRLTIPGANEDCAATGDLDITDDLFLHGAGPTATILDGGGLDRVIQILPRPAQCGGSGPAQPKVTIVGVTVQNGNVAQTASAAGGGICNGINGIAGGFLELINVTVSGNSAVYGGGIFNGFGTAGSPSSGARLESVTVTKNTAGAGGGLYTRDGGKVTIINSTFSGNTAVSQAGGIDAWFYADVTLINVTIAQNSAPKGGGIFQEYPTTVVNLRASIVANDSGRDCGGPGAAGTIVSQGYNLDSDNTCFLT
jgi:CSLREA domain-containing protein